MKPLLLILPIVFVFNSCSNKTKNSDDKTDSSQPGFIHETYEEKTTVLKQFEPTSTFPYFDNGVWGYCNKDGVPVIQAVYEKCGFFSEGYAWVVKDSKYGIIDKTGKLIIDYIYSDAGQITKGLIPVKKGNYWAFLDTTGKQVTNFLYEDYIFQEDSTIHVRQNRQWGIIDLKGKQISLPLYDYDFIFNNDLAIVRRNWKIGLINSEGTVLIECKYDDLWILNDSLIITKKCKNYKDCYFGLFSLTENKFIIPEIYRNLGNVAGQAIIAKTDKTTGLLNLKGDTLIDFTYTDLKWGNTNLLCAKGNFNYGYISFKNDTIIPFEYSDAEPFIGNYAPAKKSNNWGLINSSNKTIIPFNNQEVVVIGKNLIEVKPGYHFDYTFYDTLGNQVTEMIFDHEDYHIEPDYNGEVYNHMNFIKPVNGYFIVGKSGTIGMMNMQGNMVIPMKYHYLEPMNEYGYTIATFWNKQALFDKNGNQLTDFIYDKILWDDKAKHYYVVQNVYEKRNEYHHKKEIPVGYIGFDGKYYGNSFYTGKKEEKTEYYIKAIREAYKRIQKEDKNREYTHRSFYDGLKGSYSKSKFVVTDEVNKIRYEYYYDEDLNSYGPFFIFIIDESSGKKMENRYYYSHGKIVRWLDPDKKEQILFNALYGPEEDMHHQARVHEIMFRNEEYLNNKDYNLKQEKVDALCDAIDNDIDAGKYKKGDTESESMGEYYSRVETYLDQKGDLIYSYSSQGDEGGTVKTVEYYQDGKLIRSYSDDNFTRRGDDELEPFWRVHQYSVTNYFENGVRFRSITTENGPEEIHDF